MKWLPKLTLALILISGATPVWATVADLNSTYNLSTFSETELTDLDVSDSVTSSIANARLAVFTATVGNTTGAQAQVTLKITRDDVQTATKTLLIPTGTSTIQLISEETGLSVGSHTWEAFVSGTRLPLSFTTATTLEVVGYTTVAGLGLLDGSGTANRLTKWSDTDSLTSSIVSDDGTTVSVLSNRLNLGTGSDVVIQREAADSLQLGVDAASPAGQVIAAPDNTSSGAGGELTLEGGDALGTNQTGGHVYYLAGKGTGNADSGSILFYTAGPGASGTQLNARSVRWGINGPGVLYPGADNTGDIGSSSFRVNDIFMGGNLYLDHQGELRLGEPDGAGTNYASFKAPAILAADTNYTLPSDDGDANQVLSTDGSGVLDWVADDDIPDAGDFTNLALSGDISSSALVTTIGNDKVLEAHLKAVDAAGDEECLTYESTVGDFEWQSCGSGSSPGGASGDIQVNDGASGFTGEAAFNYSTANNRLDLTSMTAAADGTDPMIVFSGTLPSSTSAQVNALDWDITSAGSSSNAQVGLLFDIAAGYTGSSSTRAMGITNSVAGTATGLSLGTDSSGSNNAGISLGSLATTAGDNVGLASRGSGSSSTNAGVLAKAVGAVAGNNFGIIANAANSTEATDLKNVAVYGTLNTSLITGLNASFAGLFDGGTLPDSASNVVRVVGTLPSVTTAAVFGTDIQITSNGSTGNGQNAFRVSLGTGYTGGSATVGAQLTNTAAGTSTTLGLGAVGGAIGNMGGLGSGTSTGSGISIGLGGEARNSTAQSIGVYGKSASTAAGTNIGVIGTAAASTEGTDLKNVGGYFTLDNTLITGANISVALLAQGDGTDDIFRGYDDTTLIFRMEDTGEFTSAGASSIGWSVVAGANTACNTTCTNACVVGQDTGTANIFVGCTDATADVCVCAGSS